MVPGAPAEHVLTCSTFFTSSLGRHRRQLDSARGLSSGRPRATALTLLALGLRSPGHVTSLVWASVSQEDVGQLTLGLPGAQPGLRSVLPGLQSARRTETAAVSHGDARGAGTHTLRTAAQPRKVAVGLGGAGGSRPLRPFALGWETLCWEPRHPAAQSAQL